MINERANFFAPLNNHPKWPSQLSSEAEKYVAALQDGHQQEYKRTDTIAHAQEMYNNTYTYGEASGVDVLERPRSRSWIEANLPGVYPNADVLRPWQKAPGAGEYADKDMFLILEAHVRGENPRTWLEESAHAADTLPAGRTLTIIPQEHAEKITHRSDRQLAKTFETIRDPRMHRYHTLQRFALRFYKRFASYAQGAAETLADPKTMGKIFPNLLVTSIFLSASVYATLYMVEYYSVAESMKRLAAKKQGQGDQGALAANPNMTPQLSPA